MADWHPRMNAYPVAWLLRVGRWGNPYAIVQQSDVCTESGWTVTFELRAYDSKELLGAFDTGDAAAEFAWVWHLEQSDKNHREAAVRAHER